MSDSTLAFCIECSADVPGEPGGRCGLCAWPLLIPWSGGRMAPLGLDHPYGRLKVAPKVAPAPAAPPPVKAKARISHRRRDEWQPEPEPKAKRTCGWCGEMFTPTCGKQLYCSVGHQRDGLRQRRAVKTCLVCGVEFHPSRGSDRGDRKYCSRTCNGRSTAVPPVPCPICGTPFSPRVVSGKRRRKFCSRACDGVSKRGERYLKRRWSREFDGCQDPACRTPLSPHGGDSRCRGCINRDANRIRSKPTSAVLHCQRCGAWFAGNHLSRRRYCSKSCANARAKGIAS